MAKIKRYTIIVDGKPIRNRANYWAKYFGISVNHFYNLFNAGRIEDLFEIKKRKEVGWDCGWCEGTVAPGSHEATKYCSERCKREAKAKAVKKGVKKMLAKRKDDKISAGIWNNKVEDNRSEICVKCIDHVKCLDKEVYDLKPRPRKELQHLCLKLPEEIDYRGKMLGNQHLGMGVIAF